MSVAISAISLAQCINRMLILHNRMNLAFAFPIANSAVSMPCWMHVENIKKIQQYRQIWASIRTQNGLSVLSFVCALCNFQIKFSLHCVLAAKTITKILSTFCLRPENTIRKINVKQCYFHNNKHIGHKYWQFIHFCWWLWWLRQMKHLNGFIRNECSIWRRWNCEFRKKQDSSQCRVNTFKPCY